MNPEINLSPKDISALVLEKAGHEDIIEQIMVPIEGHPEEQKALITSLFAFMTVEGDGYVTNMRDAAFTILAHTQFQSILKSNPGFVLTTYIRSVRTQSSENDPSSGSIATLLDAGKVIASVLRPDKRDLNRIIMAWQKVSDDMPEDKDTELIDTAVDEIEHAAGPRPSTVKFVELDNQVEALSKRGLNRKQIAEVLNMSYVEIRNSRVRLLKAGRVEPRKKGRPKIDKTVGEIEHAVGPRPSTVEALSNQGLSRQEIAEVLNITIKLMDQIEALTEQRVRRKEIVERLNVPLYKIDSLRSLLRKRKLQL